MRRTTRLGYYLEVTVRLDDGDRYHTEKYKTTLFDSYEEAIDEAERLATGCKKPAFGHGKVWNVDIIERTVTDKRMRTYA